MFTSLGHCGMCGRQYWLVHDSEVWWMNPEIKNYISEISGLPHIAQGARTPNVYTGKIMKIFPPVLELFLRAGVGVGDVWPVSCSVSAH